MFTLVSPSEFLSYPNNTDNAYFCQSSDSYIQDRPN
jgi:hypothetical protein